jgi:hypothetical protein
MQNDADSLYEKTYGLIQNLYKLSKVYIGAPIQQEKCDEILNELRTIYKFNSVFFSNDAVSLINQLKADLSKSKLYPNRRLRLLKFFDVEKYIEASEFAKAPPFVIPSGEVVFHKTEYCIGVTVDWNPVQRSYKLLMINGTYEWYHLKNLVLVGTCRKLWRNNRVTQCWRCNEPLCGENDKCNRCYWYICSSCKACNCHRR